ncbi:hypothetical protein ABBQ38_011977 [Trebouxia sp. C0009 RCD-2024]
MLATQVEANRKLAAEDHSKLKQSVSQLRQENAEAFIEISATLADLKRAVCAAKTGYTPGPVDLNDVAQALCDPDFRKEAIRAYGLTWLLETKEQKLWPPSAFDDEDFMEAFSDLKRAAFADKHVKLDLPKPSKFSRIAVDSDIRAWLLRMQEYLTISGIESTVWTVVASNFLDQAPLQLWEARKTQLAERPEANLPMQLRIFWWERGRKGDIRAMCLVDPFTHKEYIDIAKAQSAACACDAHLFSASVAATAFADGDEDDTRVTKRSRSSDGGVQQRRCYNCGRLGHMARACPDKDGL